MRGRSGGRSCGRTGWAAGQADANRGAGSATSEPQVGIEIFLTLPDRLVLRQEAFMRADHVLDGDHSAVMRREDPILSSAIEEVGDERARPFPIVILDA